MFCVAACSYAKAQIPSQSIIYDAAMIMNAKHGVNGLKIPTSNGFVIVDPLTNSVTDMGEENAAPPSTMEVDSFAYRIIFRILRRNAGLDTNATVDQVKAAYRSNPFLKNALDSAYPKDHLARANVNEFATGRESGGGVGSDLLGNLVNGTADFLIKRAQEEISVSVFEKLKKFLSRHPELDTLFPRTCALIKPVEPYEYNKALQAFKDAIHEDLKNFIPRISLLYEIPKYNVLNKRLPSLTLVFCASALLGELHDKSGFAKAVYNLEGRSFLNEQNNYASLLKVLVIISNSLLDKNLSDPDDKTPNYINRDFIKEATHNNIQLYNDLSQIYLGLLWQHTHTLVFTTATDTKTFGELLEHWLTNSDISKAIKSINIILETMITVDNSLAKIKEEDDGVSKTTGRSIASTKRFELYANLVSQLLKLSEIYISPANGTLITRIKEIREYLPLFTNKVIIIVRDFQQEEYNLGISDFAALLKIVSDYLSKVEKNKALSNSLTSDFQTKLDAVKTSLNNQKTVLEDSIATLPSLGSNPGVNADIESRKQEFLSRKEQIESALANLNYQDNNKSSIIFKLSKIIEFVNFLASITKAENSAAVESLLETYALPAGSSRIKKVSSFNIAVNAYVGGFFGRSKDQGEGFTNTYGFTAPIGFTISTGLYKRGSFSLFVGVFDIGGVVKYKLDNQGKYQQDINFASIVSPGLHIVYGFPFFLPLSAGAGWQWISPVTTNSNKIDLKATFNAFVAVDIPLFNLANSSKKYKP
jgi:hypothetical protein